MQIVSPEIEHYLASLISVDAKLAEVAEEGTLLDLPIIDSAVGRFLETMVLSTGARQLLEIGTANGYSALWLSRSLPDDGRVISIEIDPARAAVARGHFEAAGLHRRVEVIVGEAARMVHKVAGPFDLIFNAGAKRQYGTVLNRLVRMLRPGGVLLTDNVLWGGAVIPYLESSPQGDTTEAAAIAAYNQQLETDDRLATSFLPIRDGLAVSVKRDCNDT